MKLVFCGTPRFAVPTLEALRRRRPRGRARRHPARQPVGRAQELVAPPVKQTALAAGIAVTQPEKIRNNAEFRAQLESIAPDAIVVVAYGRIIPPWMLALPRLGCINLHGSLLPKYRGAAPIQWAVAEGETVTGNTTMLLEEGLDTGPILLQQQIEIGSDQTAADLFSILSERGAPLVVETLAGLDDGSIKPKPQEHALATLAPLLTREDGQMNFATRTATELRIAGAASSRGPARSPCSTARNSLCTAWPSVAWRARFDAKPGQVRSMATASCRLLAEHLARAHEVQLEGKKRMTAAEFLRGTQL